jgi:malate dehydrogenase (oxaloacetate-decarboxylating)
MAAMTNTSGLTGSIEAAMRGADVYIGVSAGQVADEAVATMAPDAFVFALANPNPEIHPEVARRHARVVATGRSDFPNQINNVLAFPGVFRGLLDAGSRDVDDDMLIAAATAIADAVGPERLNASFIVPSVFDAQVAPGVAAAVREVAQREGRTGAGS